jgi:hypothetical protein
MWHLLLGNEEGFFQRFISFLIFCRKMNQLSFKDAHTSSSESWSFHG